MERLVRTLEPYDEHTDMTPRYENLTEVGFGGIATNKLQVLQSAAGYYIGTLEYDKEDQQWYPYMRDSECYWNTREEAEEALNTGKYPVKFQ